MPPPVRSAALTQPFDLRKYSQQYVNNLSMSGGQIPGAPPKSRTEYQQELIPYLRQEVQEEADKRGLLQPIEMIFDVLQRGQYLTANIAERLVRNIRGGEPLLEGMPDAVKSAMSGRVKGDWETVLFGGKSPGGEKFEGIRPWEPTTGGGKVARKVTGFLANVLADPLTYVGAGPATAARTAATKYSDDAVRALVGRLGRDADDILPGIIQKGVDWQAFTTKFNRSAAEGLSYLQKYAGEDMTKLMSKIKKEAYTKALRNPSSQLPKFDNLIDDVLKRYQPTKPGMRQVTAMAKPMQPMAQEAAQRAGQIAGPATDTAALSTLRRMEPQVMFDPEALGANLLPGEAGARQLIGAISDPYAGAGTRAWRVFRKEFNVSERYPAWLRQLGDVKNKFNESKIGGTFSDAWWALLNNPKSPVANLRKMFHVRNPYQKMLSIMERDVVSETSYEMVNKGERITTLLEGLTDEERKTVTGAMLVSQVGQELAKESSQVIPARASDIISKFAPDDPDVAAKLTKVVDEINTMTDEWLQYMRWAKDQGFTNDIGAWADYLPVQPRSKTQWRRAGTAIGRTPPAYGKARKVGFAGHMRQQKEKLQWAFGMDDEMAERVLTEGGANLNLDLEDMLMRRAFAQTRFEQRVNMISQFREFGFNVKNIQKVKPELHEAMVGKWGELDALGLRPIQNEMGLEGYLFDNDVAEILTRAVEASSSDSSMRAFVKAASSITSWWRGWATLSPGFHARNAMSNNVTGFLKHGVDWFDPKTHTEAFVATSIGLHGYEEGIKRLSKILPEKEVVAIASRRIGDRTLAELAQLGGGHGIISRMSRGFKKPDSYDEVLKSEGKIFDTLNVNPMSTSFTPMQASRNLGSYIESESKFASFLFDYKRGVKQGANSDAAFEFAKQEAKKWWIDYSDLSKFERDVMRNVVPFYCVPTDGEILTREGWKKYDEITPNKTEVLAYDIETDTAFWKVLKGVAVFDYNGMLMSIKNRTNGEYLFTPDHGWPVFYHSSYGTKTKRKLVKGYQLKSDYRIPLVAGNTEISDECPITPREAEIIGWLLTDGHIREKGDTYYEYLIYQSKIQFVEVIRELLGEDASEAVQKREKETHADMHVFRINGQLRKRLQDIITKKTQAPELVTWLDLECAEIMWDAMYKGDGTIVVPRKDRPGTKTDMFFAAQENTENGKAVGDTFQILSVLINKVAHKQKNGRGMYIRKNPERRFIKIGKDSNALGTEWYAGKIWCPEIDGLCWYLRRNGKHILTKNTWIRGNISNQLSGLMQFTEMYSMIPKAQDALTMEGGPEREEMPEWMRELGMLPVGQNKGNTMLFWPNFPYQDLNKIPMKFQFTDEGIPLPIAADPIDAVKDIMSDAHPALKTVIQLVGDIDVFYQEPLGETRKAPRGLRVLTDSPQVLTFLDGLLRGVGFQDGLRADVDDKGRLMIDSRIGKALEDNILPLRMIPQYLDLPELIFPAIEDWKKKAFGAVDDYEALEEFFQTLSFYGGIKFKELELKDREFWENEELMERAEAELRKDKRKLPGAAVQKQDWIEDRRALQRRMGL